MQRNCAEGKYLAEYHRSAIFHLSTEIHRADEHGLVNSESDIKVLSLKPPFSQDLALQTRVI